MRCCRHPYLSSQLQVSRTTGCGAWCVPIARKTPKGLLAPTKVTNTGDEIWKSFGSDPLDDSAGEYVELTQIPNPELGPLEGRVKRTWMEGLSNNEIDYKETEYWFSTPPEGWVRERYFQEYSPEAEVEFGDARHYGEGRTAIEDIEEGQVVEGEVTDQWLYHGAEVDIGAQFDGLIPIQEPEWKAVRGVLVPGAKVKVRVHKVRHPATLWRWPIQLTVEEPAGVQPQLIAPDEWVSPVDTRGWEPEVIAALTGRHHEVLSYYVNPHEADMAEMLQQEYGYDDEDMQMELDDEEPEQRAYWDNEDAQDIVEGVVLS